MIRAAAGTLAVLILAACSSAAVGVLPTVHPAQPSSNTLQLAVGTARIGLAGGGSALGLNVVATYRQPSGASATLQNTPTLTAPSAIFPNYQGATNVMAGIGPGLLHTYAVNPGLLASAPPPSSGGQFGALIGAFGYGLAPLNLVDFQDNLLYYQAVTAINGDIGTCNGPFGDAGGAPVTGGYPSGSLLRPDQAITLPLFAGSGCDGYGSQVGSPGPNPPAPGFRYLGGPPAWPSPQGYQIPAGFQGFPVGFTDFNVPPATGTYGLDVAYPTSTDASTSGHAMATATLGSANALPFMPAPVLRVSADGSALVDLTVPIGVGEAIVFVRENACFTNQNASNYYSLVTYVPGQQTLALTANLGPPDANGKPTHTFCTAADTQAPNANPNGAGSGVAVAVGFDYPAYEASYPQSTTPRPVIVGSAGTADITTSPPAQFRPAPAVQAIRRRPGAVGARP